MTKYLFPVVFAAVSFVGLGHAETIGQGRHQYISKVNDSTEATANCRYSVEFNEKWLYFPSLKKWKNQSGQVLSALELLEQGKITLRPMGAPSEPRGKTLASRNETLITATDRNTKTEQLKKPRKTTSAFVYIWDETKKNQIRVFCTGLGTYHKGIKR